jgi:hypothetical protein
MTDDSILRTIKKLVGIAADQTAFDLDIITHINSAFLTLNQIGVGPEGGFLIEDAEAEWWDLLGDDPRLNAVKTYIGLKVRLVFDPPNTGYVIAAFEKQIEELEWRLCVQVEPASVVLPTQSA